MKASNDFLPAFARVIRTAIGVVVAYWDVLGLAPGHPYRHALSMIDCFLKKRFD